MIVPGGALHREKKRWPIENYLKLCKKLAIEGITPILIGSEAEHTDLKFIKKNEPSCINLNSMTSFGHIAQIARNALFAVGNDTGPMHIIAATNCKSIILFSDESDPSQTAPCGKFVMIIQNKNLKNLSVQEVYNNAEQLF